MSRKKRSRARRSVRSAAGTPSVSRSSRSEPRKRKRRGEQRAALSPTVPAQTVLIGRYWRFERRTLALLALLLLFASILRFQSYDFGLPYQLHPDEPHLFITAKWLAKPGGIESWDKDSFMYKIETSYPPFYSRMLLIQHIAIRALVGPEPPQSTYFAVARIVNVVLSLLTIVVIFLAGSLIADSTVGLMAALFVTFNPAIVENARYAVADTPMILFFCLCLYLGLIALRDGPRWMAYAGLLCGFLAFGTKYNALPVLIVPVYALLRRAYPDRRRLLINVGSIAVVMGVGFWIFISRFNMLDIVTVPGSPTGSILDKGNPFRLLSISQNWQILVPALGGYLGLLTVSVGIIAMTYREADWRIDTHNESFIIIVWLVIAYFFMMSLFEFHGIRDLLPLLTMYALLWGVAVRVMGKWIIQWLTWPESRSAWVTFALALVLSIWPVVEIVRHNFWVGRTDTRAITADWFIANAPDGAIIAVEYDAVEFMPEYGGFPGPKHFQPMVVQSLFQHSLEQYRQAGIRYMVADERAKGNGGYFSDPGSLEFTARVRMALDIPNDHNPGPRRVIFELVD